MLKIEEIDDIARRFEQFILLSEEERLSQLPHERYNMCTDDWGKKVTLLLKKGRGADEQLIQEVFAHINLDVLDGTATTTEECPDCRKAFLRVVFKTTMKLYPAISV
jgi:hypothetical protein